MTNDTASMSRTLLEKDRLDGVFVGLIVERLSANQPCQDYEPQRRGQHFIHDFHAARFLVELPDTQSARPSFGFGRPATFRHLSGIFNPRIALKIDQPSRKQVWPAHPLRGLRVYPFDRCVINGTVSSLRGYCKPAMR